MTASSPDQESNGIVSDGRERVAQANRKEIEKRVREQYADELASVTGLFRRWSVRRKIRREIQDELEEIALRDVLYLGK